MLNKTFKVIIAGGRDFDDHLLLIEKCNKILANKENIEIVSGGAKGADSLGANYAEYMGYALTEFPADWDRLGKAAGYIRNEQMAKYADALIAFWDTKSRGTKHMIDLAKKYGLPTRIINY